MGLTRYLSRLFGGSIKRPSLAVELDPIELSTSQKAQIEIRIADFLTDSNSISVYSEAIEGVKRENVLPLFFEWLGFFALSLEGQVVSIPYKGESSQIEPIRESKLRNLALCQGAKRYPDLPFLIPSRPKDAMECPACRGTGRVTLAKGQEHLAEKVICSCGGLGWLNREPRACGQ